MERQRLSEPILQWRKLCGETSLPQKNEKSHRQLKSSNDVRHAGGIKVSRQDSINREARMRRQQQDHDAIAKNKLANRDKVERRKLHIVQTKKAQYPHLLSSQKISAKCEDERPVVYDSVGKEEGRKEVAALWLQPFTIIDDYMFA
eukprot:CAMPEP_0181127354 /NCGR_PEP_ID=MMETSP1071-20121207/28150_1 /TAXON_ID=35127 /ORGANISM="Thalassiosira sp., Strain NH16" /LENGTH=145 /DNA_ID=CAMNT_0023213081 /DNA_START=824 /DNA_END=1258 /DNA_ORIENTATION=+